MLYISRIPRVGTYGVVDTDDGVETWASWKNLEDAVIGCGITIHGVTTAFRQDDEYIDTVIPYQDTQYCVPMQAKVKSLLGVDIRIFKDEIVYIQADKRLTPADTRIRLSDYAKSIEGGALMRWNRNESNKKLILVLDDNFKFKENMPSFISYGIVWDISEFSDEAVVSHIYKELMQTKFIDYAYWGSHIIDRPGRDSFWRCIHMLDSNVSEEEDYAGTLNSTENFSEICTRIAEMNIREFTDIANRIPEFLSGTKWYSSNLVSMVHKFFEDNPDQSALEDYEKMKAGFIGVFNTLKAGGMNYYTIRRFENFMRYYIVPESVQAVFIKLCMGVVEAVREYDRQEGY